MIEVYKKFFVMIILTFIAYLFVYNFPSYAEKKNPLLDRILKELEQEKIKEDNFYQCWLDNIKPNSTSAHSNVVALYCKNKTGHNPLKN